MKNAFHAKEPVATQNPQLISVALCTAILVYPAFPNRNKFEKMSPSAVSGVLAGMALLFAPRRVPHAGIDTL
jgi:hypothetical protein